MLLRAFQKYLIPCRYNVQCAERLKVHRSLAEWFTKRWKNESLGKKNYMHSLVSSNQNGPQRMIIINYLFRNANSFSIWFVHTLTHEICGGKLFFCFSFLLAISMCYRLLFSFSLEIVLSAIHWCFANVISHIVVRRWKVSYPSRNRTACVHQK